MRPFRPTTGPFRQGYYFENDELDDICCDALRENGCLPTEPAVIDVERFLEKRYGTILSYEDLPPGCLGCTVFEKTGKVRALAVHRDLADGSKSGDCRVRSTWAHEAGHALLHAALFADDGSGRQNLLGASADIQEDRILCRGDDIQPSSGSRPYGGRWWEWQANYCIGGLLLPKHLVRLAVEPYLAKAAITKGASLPEKNREAAEASLVDIFEVSAMVARIRLQGMFPLDSGRQVSF